jgi:electron transport complex protein RnfD
MTDGFDIRSTRGIMLTVAVCLIPGIAVQAALLDVTGVAMNVAAALATAILTERVCLRCRGRRTPWLETDPAALVTALILAAALPPGAAAATAFATATALALGKHAYGGPGGNLFNPAMVGYAAVLVSFPAAVAHWPLGGPAPTDGLTGATALTTFRYRGGATVDEIWTPEDGFGLLGAASHEWIALAFLAGGLMLFALRLAAWRPAAGMVVTVSLLAMFGYDNGSSASLGSPLFHLFSGGTLLAAGFVLTDPVTHPRHPRDQWLFGILVGAAVFAIRSWGNYPDGIAFAVLLANAVTPYLDRRSSLAMEVAQ